MCFFVIFCRYPGDHSAGWCNPFPSTAELEGFVSGAVELPVLSKRELLQVGVPVEHEIRRHQRLGAAGDDESPVQHRGVLPDERMPAAGARLLDLADAGSREY